MTIPPRSVTHRAYLMALATLTCILLLPTTGCQPADTRPTISPPAWSADVVWYQIFPERFHNGDPGNDPQREDILGGWPYFVPENWQVSPWTSDWYKLQPWEQGIPWHEHFDWASPEGPHFYPTAGLRRYGGDLQGVLDKLDYLQELGITAIYLNPVFESPSLHKYDAAMYHHIDNNFGPDPDGDRQIWEQEDPSDPSTWKWTSADRLFLKLIEECHRRGMRIIIDGVFNHTGNLFWAFQDVVRNQSASPYRDWFIIHSWDNPDTPENEFEYAGWYGVADLPEIREDENGLVAGPREHIHDIVKRWMDPNGDGDPSDGIDGWRLDVAEMVELEFWKVFRGWVRDINPEAYLTGEVWWENWDENKMFNAAPWFDGAFDAVMNYRTARGIKHFFIDIRDQVPAQGFVDTLQAIYRDYRAENVLACMNLMDSHDTDRLSSQIVNPDRWFDHAASAQHNPDYLVRKPTEAEWQKLRLVAGIQMTLPGAPMVFYGGEAGMWGGDDPDERKPMVWPEFEYEPEVVHPLGKERPVDAVAFDQSLHDWYALLISIRHKHPALRSADIEFVEVDNENAAIVYRRTGGGESVLVAVNNNESPQTISLSPSLAPGEWRDEISGGVITAGDHALDIPLGPRSLMILVRDEGR